MNIYIINLQSAIKRKEFQQQQCKKLKLEYCFFKAINCNDISQRIYNVHQNDWKKTLDITEIATYYSHKKLWEKVVQKNQPALILEDDALLSNKLPVLLNQLNHQENIDLINLETHGKKKRLSNQYKAIDYYFNITKVYQGRIGAAGYVLYPSGAKKLLKNKTNSIAPADVYITNCHQLVSYQILPASVIQLENCFLYDISPPIKTQSSIQKPQSSLSFKKIIYQFKRMLYYAKFSFHKKQTIPINTNDFIL